MIFIRIVKFLTITIVAQLILTDSVWAWGPAVHTAIGCKVMEGLPQVLPFIGEIIRCFPLQFIYGNLAADFFVGKGEKERAGHSHNWESGFKILGKAKHKKDAAYAFGFLSHLAADVVAHNYFIPNLIHRCSTWRRAGHIYWEAKADRLVNPAFTRIAREVLGKEELGFDDMLISALRTRSNGLKARRHLFTQSVKWSEYLYMTQPLFSGKRSPRYQIEPAYLVFMVDLSFRLVRDFLKEPQSSPCLSYDPIGSRNLRLASKNAIRSRFFKAPRATRQFNVDQDLLDIS